MDPRDYFLSNISGLVSTKSVVSLLVMAIFAFKVFSGAEVGIEYMTIFSVVITYWLCDGRGRAGKKEEERK